MHVGESRAFPQGTEPRVVKWDGVKVWPADATGRGGGGVRKRWQALEGRLQRSGFSAEQSGF